MILREDFFSEYLAYAGKNEIPAVANRWSAIASIGAFLGKDTFFRFGHQNIYPNIFCILIGNAGSKKSTAIKMIRPHLVAAGYVGIAASKTTKEKYMLDLSDAGVDDYSENFLDKQLFGDANDTANSFIMADELNDFFGNNNLEFISLLGSLWDWEGPYQNRIKNGKSFTINNPCISLLGGNTPTGFSTAFPPEIIGQGFFSRILLIYCEPKGIKVTFPYQPTQEENATIVKMLLKMKETSSGEIKLSSTGEKLLDRIYKSWINIDDIRFDSYSNRRFSHLLKLCIIHAAASYQLILNESVIIYANTVLSYAEHFMPKALGEFGKGKNSDVTHKIIQLLDRADIPLSIKDIWKHVNNDLEKMGDLTHLLSGLINADKIQNAAGGFIGKKKIILNGHDHSGLIDYSLLTEEERRLI